MTSGDNMLKATVERSAEEWNCVPIGYRRLPYSEDDLVKFIWHRKGRDVTHEAMVCTEWMEVTRAALSTLRPRQWVMDQVIDMFGIKTTLHRPDLLYLPSTVIVNCTKKKNPCIWNQYISGTYKPVNGATIRKVFIPLIKDKHWWACICDMESKTNYILNSSNSVQSYDVHNTTIDTVLIICLI
ncbi:uncharacterized protein LOC141649152 [Silene latifolia]|uniref:uncharacterized protein LOC141649152 n=1 Tax=Silene latifolia TaxID=37657 RepID=UPI003D789FE9